MLKHLRSIVAVLARRFRSRAVLELENLALRHQLHVLHRQRPGRPQRSRFIICLPEVGYRTFLNVAGHRN
jgi:hypothetical protein